MSTPKELHREAMAFVGLALARQRDGDVAGYLALMRQAMPLEERAARLLADRRDAEPTRSLILRSAAHIAKVCGDRQVAKELIYLALLGTPPADLRLQLEDLNLELLLADRALEQYSVEESAYLDALRGYAINLRIVPTIQKFSRAVVLDNVITVLQKIRSSWSGFVEGSFRNAFGVDLFGDSTDEIISRLRMETTPLVVDERFSSFGVSIAADTNVMPSLYRPEVNNWKANLFEEFKKDVIYLDYASTTEVARIRDKYSESDRENIYPAIFAISKDSNPYTVSLASQDFRTIEKRLTPVAKPQRDLIVNPLRDRETEEPKELIRELHLATPGKKGRVKQGDIIDSEAVDSAVINKVVVQLGPNDNYLSFLQGFEFKINYERPIFSIEDHRFGVSVADQSHKEAFDKFSRAVIAVYDRLVDKDDSELSADEKTQKNLLRLLVHARSLK